MSPSHTFVQTSGLIDQGLESGLFPPWRSRSGWEAGRSIGVLRASSIPPQERMGPKQQGRGRTAFLI